MFLCASASFDQLETQEGVKFVSVWRRTIEEYGYPELDHKFPMLLSTKETPKSLKEQEEVTLFTIVWKRLKKDSLSGKWVLYYNFPIHTRKEGTPQFFYAVSRKYDDEQYNVIHAMQFQFIDGPGNYAWNFKQPCRYGSASCCAGEISRFCAIVDKNGNEIQKAEDILIGSFI
ncbi:MAG: hypothetical protein ACJAZS_000764 [Alteromonas naphthalenivorans]